jgi:hypothetical protein
MRRMPMRTWPSLLVVALLTAAPSASGQEASVVNPVSVRAGEIECTVTDHGAIPEGDARTAADLLCGELLERGAPADRYEVRFGKLDSNVLVTVTRTRPYADSHTAQPPEGRASKPTSRRILLSSLSEMPVAAQRLATALITDKPVAETEGADNVTAAEARRPTTKNGTLAGTGEIIAQTHVGAAAGLSGGFGLGLDFRLQSVSILVRGRAGGIGDSDRTLSFASADVGGRYYPFDSSTAPFAGAALVVAHWNVDGSPDHEGSGMGAAAELGVDALRNAKVGISGSVRADLPFFDLDGTWIMPLSFNVGVAFR